MKCGNYIISIRDDSALTRVVQQFTIISLTDLYLLSLIHKLLLLEKGFPVAFPLFILLIISDTRAAEFHTTKSLLSFHLHLSIRRVSFCIAQTIAAYN